MLSQDCVRAVSLSPVCDGFTLWAMETRVSRYRWNSPSHSCFVVSIFRNYIESTELRMSFTGVICTFSKLPQRWVCSFGWDMPMINWVHSAVSSLSSFLCIFYQASFNFAFSQLCILMCRRNRQEENFVWSCKEAAVERKRGRPLCVNLLVVLWVWRGIKTDRHTKSARYTVNRALLYPALPPSSPLSFSTDVFVIREQRGPGQEATRRLSSEISSVCWPLISWLQELCAVRLW